ncbi:hypothetical protein H4W80_004355 [Nonomuraea angiospora]|uniref:Uncharacterized protein n=1 Tax=Nonomuraea angiospora TaxID=46172 RepID=A0ABR9LZM1_9ACTN|nr:hypothetical protein [Nonomuraea angiospora]
MASPVHRWRLLAVPAPQGQHRPSPPHRPMAPPVHRWWLLAVLTPVGRHRPPLAHRPIAPPPHHRSLLARSPNAAVAPPAALRRPPRRRPWPGALPSPPLPSAAPTPAAPPGPAAPPRHPGLVAPWRLCRAAGVLRSVPGRVTDKAHIQRPRSHDTPGQPGDRVRSPGRYTDDHRPHPQHASAADRARADAPCASPDLYPAPATVGSPSTPGGACPAARPPPPPAALGSKHVHHHPEPVVTGLVRTHSPSEGRRYRPSPSRGAHHQGRPAFERPPAIGAPGD